MRANVFMSASSSRKAAHVTRFRLSSATIAGNHSKRAISSIVASTAGGPEAYAKAAMGTDPAFVFMMMIMMFGGFIDPGTFMGLVSLADSQLSLDSVHTAWLTFQDLVKHGCA